MSDAALVWFPFGADININNGDLSPDNGLATAVMISLLTDARAPDLSLLPDGENELRGWWGDIDDFKTGSLLWLINREKTLPGVAVRAREACINALEWLREEEIAEKVEVSAQIVKPLGLEIIIKIHRGTSRRYSYLWDAIVNYESITVQNTGISIEFLE
jgi:phage gp46-like protein